jgi:hypothetical protein
LIKSTRVSSRSFRSNRACGDRVVKTGIARDNEAMLGSQLPRALAPSPFPICPLPVPHLRSLMLGCQLAPVSMKTS